MLDLFYQANNIALADVTGYYMGREEIGGNIGNEKYQ